MKILYHHRIRSKDGQFVHLDELTRALKQRGHEIIMVGPQIIETEDFGADAGFVALLKKYFPKFLYELLEFSYSILDYRSLVRAYKKHRPDCLYERYNLYFLSGAWLRKKYSIPMLLEVNAPLYDERRKYSGIALDWFARWTERRAWRAADYVLPVTRVLADYVTAAGVPESKIVVIPNGINAQRFGDTPGVDEAKRALGLSGLVLGFVGFMREWHRLERVVDMIAEHKEQGWQLLLVGDGPVRQDLQRQARERGVADRVTITGVVDRDHVANYIAAFDIALQPHVVEYASPLKLFEYLALGRAIVAPDTANIKEILTDGENAVLFDVSQAEDFIRAVKCVCQDQALRARVSDGAKATIERLGLTWENNARRVEALFQEKGVY